MSPEFVCIVNRVHIHVACASVNVPMHCAACEDMQDIIIFNKFMYNKWQTAVYDFSIQFYTHTHARTQARTHTCNFSTLFELACSLIADSYSQHRP